MTTVTYNMLPYQSPHVPFEAEKEAKKLSPTAIGATIAIAGTLMVTQPSLHALPTEKGITIMNAPNKVLNDVISNPISRTIVSTLTPDVHVDNSVQHDVQKSTTTAESHRSETNVKTNNKEVAQPDAIAFDPAQEYGKVFAESLTVYNHPKLGTLTNKEVAAIKDSMIRPVPRDTYDKISSAFQPRQLKSSESFHHGVDYPAPIGTPIYAAAEGKVIYSGAAGGYGNWIVIEHHINGETLYTIYGHMTAKDLYVKEGQTVKQGQKISAVNSQGFSTGAHLHFSIAKSRDSKTPRIFYDYINPTFTVDTNKSNTFEYPGHKIATVASSPSVDKEKYWKLAIKASKKTGWNPLFIMSQWELESTHFTSNNFKKNNNLAGQTWYPGCKYEKGSPRPTSEGGHYIKYPTPVEGYVDFIKTNPRYSDVKHKKTPEAQAQEVANQGWAVDPDYAEKLSSMINKNRKLFGDVKTPEVEKKESEKPVDSSKTEEKTDTTTSDDKKETPTNQEQPTKDNTQPKDSNDNSSSEKPSDSENVSSKEDTTKEKDVQAPSESLEENSNDTVQEKEKVSDEKKDDVAPTEDNSSEKTNDTAPQSSSDKKSEDDKKEIKIEDEDEDIPFILDQFLKK